MPKEPRIMQMDWRSLGYWPVYNNGRLEWEKEWDNVDVDLQEI